MKTIIIGVMPQEQIRASVIDIAKGEYKPKPKPGEHKIWYTSMKSVAECQRWDHFSKVCSSVMD